MSDREKVIEGLEYLIAAYAFSGDDAQCLGDAVELLKEQEAKPVIVTTNAYGTKFYHCPKCNRDLYAYPRQLYCSNCGQAVKWDD